MSDVAYTDREARAATDGQIDADTVDGQHASDLGNHIEAKSGSCDSNGYLSPTWSSSFPSAPAITSTAYANDTAEAFMEVTSRSTTGGQVRIWNPDGTTDDDTAFVMAMEEN